MFQTFVPEWKIQWRIFKIDFCHLIIFLSTLEDSCTWITIILVPGKLSFFIKFIFLQKRSFKCLLHFTFDYQAQELYNAINKNIYLIYFVVILSLLKCQRLLFIFIFICFVLIWKMSSHQVIRRVDCVDCGGSKYNVGPQVFCRTQLMVGSIQDGRLAFW